ncbi:hypothetical protein PDESU_03020 [Pontiella desulfatans]|uniref:Ferric oxidoreductase domain-containing protein n=2 Tax=Pontiella desulfatans TaxID=2750659 RepID=A0A6C2U372_PONDE|nr:hypothetical protein PDESU_03020 [Pontiella desulfatans]
MNKWIFASLYLLFFAWAPVYLALTQEVPTRFTYQHVVLLVSLSGFGSLLGLFWLSRLLPRNAVQMRYSSTLRWHKYIGYAAGGVMLLHPFLMVARRLWVEESNPVGNFMLMLRSPLLLTGIIAWCLLLVIVVVALVRKKLPANVFRHVHGLLSIGFVGLATWHVITVGRHSSPAMSGFWIVLASGAVGALLWSYRPVRKKAKLNIYEGTANESA